MKVEDYMTGTVLFVSPQDNLVKAAQMMGDANVGCLPVEENNKVVGMLTDRDIVTRGVASSKKPEDITCKDAMSQTVFTVDKNEDVKVAIDFMSEHKIRRLPVTENGDVVGIVSFGDIADSEVANDVVGETISQISQKTWESRKV